MKNNRILKMAAALLLALCVCLPFTTAYAVDAEDVFYISVDNCIRGNNYVLMLLEPGTNLSSIQDSDLLFIDQYTADAQETMKIAVVYPDFSACDAAVSGTFSNNASSPRKLGSFQAARVPGMLRTIEEQAFFNAGFTHVYLGESVESIGAEAFAGCANLRYIYIPSSVTQIADNAFQGDGLLTIGCRQNSAALQFARDKNVPYVVLN